MSNVAHLHRRPRRSTRLAARLMGACAETRHYSVGIDHERRSPAPRGRRSGPRRGLGRSGNESDWRFCRTKQVSDVRSHLNSLLEYDKHIALVSCSSAVAVQFVCLPESSHMMRSCIFLILLALSVPATTQVIVPGSPCDTAGTQAQRAMQEVDNRLSSSSAARAKVCAQVNTIKIAIWANERCSQDPQFNSVQKAQISAQIAAFRANLRELETIAAQMGSTDATACKCWTDIC